MLSCKWRKKTILKTYRKRFGTHQLQKHFQKSLLQNQIVNHFPFFVNSPAKSTPVTLNASLKFIRYALAWSLASLGSSSLYKCSSGSRKWLFRAFGVISIGIFAFYNFIFYLNKKKLRSVLLKGIGQGLESWYAFFL